MSPAEVLAAAVEAGDPPAAQACVLADGRARFESAHGCAHDSVFDVASVTKVAATTSALARLVADGEVGLDDSVRRFLPGAAFDASVRALLGHRAGLPAWRPLFREVMADPVASACFSREAVAPPEAWARAREIVMRAVSSTPAPTPGRREYSDLGFLALGAVIEAVSGSRLDRFCAAHVFGDRDLGFVDLGAPSSWLDGRHVLATGTTRPRAPAPGQEGLFEVPAQEEAPDPGRVDDDNAFAMGGVAGHAGVFATARALAEHAHATWIEDALGSTRGAFLVRDPADGPPRALGWDVPTPGSSAGALGAGARVLGHLGYTGCSLWLDLDRRLVAVLLTNRTLPGRHRVEGIRALRVAFHDAVATACLA
ncbi:MAG: beta-lactamase family protein [Sandaracinaceae bacterium]|nr:beta-lactamase family protein [Sandaracinaceae bacterium]